MVPRILLDRSVQTAVDWLEIASTIAVAAILWTSFGTTVTIVIIGVVVTWVQCLLLVYLVTLTSGTSRNHERK